MLLSWAWRKKNPTLNKLNNLIAYLTLMGLLRFEGGKDLVSHEMARLCQYTGLQEPKELQNSRVNWTVKSRRAQLRLSDEEIRQELEVRPNAPLPTFETSNKKSRSKRLH